MEPDEIDLIKKIVKSIDMLTDAFIDFKRTILCDNRSPCNYCNSSSVDISKLKEAGCHYCAGCGRRL